MTIQKILKSSPLPSIEKELLIAHVIHKPREFVIAHPECKIGVYAYLKIKKLFRQNIKGIPLAYLTGHKAFYGLDFFVNKHVLIPRPETELLVELVLKKIKTLKKSHNKIILADIGTGSGCIPISIAKNINKSKYSNYIATDISNKALHVAKKNAKKHNTDITFLHGNLFEPLSKKSEIIHYTSEIILTANLPYITEKQFQDEPSIQHEPKQALVAQDHGLALYKELLEQLHIFLKNNKSNITLYFEIDPTQTDTLSSHIKKVFPNTKIKTYKDLCGRDRTIEIIIINSKQNK
jgi:release factor glutamine methyltransferase